jgi:thiosulfate reductase/polysulfide reductase chain A
MAVTNAFVEASIPAPENNHQLRGWIVTATNLPLTMPDKKKLQEAMQELELLVVVDTMPMDIVSYADVVLPECTYLERYDELRDSTEREPYIALRMPAAEPAYDTRPAWWIAKSLGEKLGLGEYFAYNDITEVLDWQLKQLGTSLEDMKKTGIRRYERSSRDLYLTPGEDYGFNTPTGKIELYSTSLADAGFDPMPVYTPHPEPPEGYYRLIYGRAPMHTFGRTSNNPNLHDLMEENALWVNPKVADLWNLKKDQYIWLKNQDGVVSGFPVKVRVTERIRWDSVYIVHGFGHKNNKLKRAFGNGANDSELITNVAIDPVMGGTGMRGNFVTFLTKDPGKEAEL